MIAVYYGRWANNNADRISNELARELRVIGKRTQALIRRTS